MSRVKSMGLFTVLCASLATSGNAQTCAKPKDSEWKKVILVDASSPVKLDCPVAMSILPDGKVFLIEMWTGKIKLFTPNSGLTEVATLNVHSDTVENGLLGIAADPKFAQNNWVYVLYSRKVSDKTTNAGDGNVKEHEHVLARLTFSNGKLGNLREILSFPRQSKRHAGGGINFNNATGDLYIPTGDDVFPGADETRWGGRNEAKPYLNDLSTAANTNDLRGKILRITPIPFADNTTPEKGIGKTYNIPAGNLFPLGKAGTRPEIYTMGHRNPYKVKIDPISGVALIGEVGPDAPGPSDERGPTGSDEFNLVTGSGNYGWPFAIADNQPYKAFTGEAYAKGTVFDLNNLKNLSAKNTGIQDLPPAIGAFAYYNALYSQTGPDTSFEGGAESAIAGPYYRYDADKPAVRMPAFFHGKFIVGDYSRGKVWTLEMNGEKKLKQVENLWKVSKLIDLGIGPNGEAYVLSLGSGGGVNGSGASQNTGTLYKMEYTGVQYAANACSQYVLPSIPVGIAAAGGSGSRARISRMLVNTGLQGRFMAPVGSRQGMVFDLKGGLIWKADVREGEINLPAGMANNLGFLQFQ